MTRVAKIDDIDAICDIKLKMFEESGHADLLHKNAKQLILHEYVKMYRENNAIHFLEEINNKIVACAGAFIKNDIPYCFFLNPEYGFIGDVYT